jgi:hypothetical protein
MRSGLTGWEDAAVQKRPIGAIVVWSLLSALVALIAGWLGGMWATCGASCAFDVALFDAYGSWVGGLAVPVALFGFTVYTHVTTKRAERDAAFGLALMCVVRPTPVLGRGGVFDAVQFEFKNGIAEPVFNPELHIEDGKTIRRDRIVSPGYKWAPTEKLDAFDLPKFAVEEEVRRAINTSIRPTVVFTFTIRGYRFARRGSEVYFYDNAPDWRAPKKGNDSGVEEPSVGPSRVGFLRGRAGRRA